MQGIRPKILLVDDEPDILEFLGYNLRKEGYEIFTASNGKAGLELALQIIPDLIILDIMMPEMDGIEMCRRLRSYKEGKQITVAFLTAKDEDFTQVAALDEGGDDYISKPIRPKVFISRIKALLRRPKFGFENEDNIIKIANITIDKEKIMVYVDENPIDLTKKEFELLLLLVTKPGKVFTREEIFAKLWGSDIIVGNRTIDVHVRKIREKIGLEYVKTIKGIGYKFEF
jgi:two-component system, OmpR family, alkaline phosphatase synthesis response regulator PhoP